MARYRDGEMQHFFRADAAFANPKVYEFLEKEEYLYAIRLPANDVLQRLAGLEGQRASADAADGNKLTVLEVKRKRGQARAVPESLASAVNPLDGTAIAPAELIQKAS